MMSNLTFRFPRDVQNDNKDMRYIILEFVSLEGETIKESVDNINKLYDEMKGRDINSALKQYAEKVEVNVSDDFQGARQSQDYINKPVFGVQLPFPNSLKEASTQKWSEGQGVISSITSDLMGMQVPGFKMNLSKFVGDTARKGGFRKPIVNPQYFQDYEGPDVRSFQFDWTLVPNSRDEFMELAKILYNLKKFTSPTRTPDGFLLVQPYHVNITFQSKTLTNIINMDLLVCSDINIDWGDNTLLMQDGTPREIGLSMTFKERTALTSNDYAVESKK